MSQEKNMPEQITDLTTTQLAEKVAIAVKQAINTRPEAWKPGCWVPGDAAQAVLRTLLETGHWFCKVTETEYKTEVQQLPYDHEEK